MPAKSDLTTAQLTDFLSANYGCDINSDAVRHACVEFGVTYPTAVKRLRDFYVKRGTWNLTVQERLEQTYESPAAAPAVEQNLIPVKDENYVPFGNFSDVKKIIQSGIFYPTFITGLSGNGKTFSVEQACAALNRDCLLYTSPSPRDMRRSRMPSSA